MKKQKYLQSDVNMWYVLTQLDFSQILAKVFIKQVISVSRIYA